MRIRGLLLDLDGTLYVGEEPVEGAREAMPPGNWKVLPGVLDQDRGAALLRVALS